MIKKSYLRTTRLLDRVFHSLSFDTWTNTFIILINVFSS